jgi:hypothetical protein
MVEDDGRLSGVKLQTRENHLDFLYELYQKEIPISDESINLLKKNGYIQQEVIPEQPVKKEEVTDDINELALKYSTEESREADTLLDIISTSNVPKDDLEIITSSELEKRRQEYGHIFEGRKTEIKREEWLPKSTTEHEQDFIDWIDSINKKGFSERRYYKKFSLYCQQAYQWLSENKSYMDIPNEDEQDAFKEEECRRCDENSLYILNKYIWYQEGNAEDKTGRIKYTAWPIHEFLAYLHDCKYSVIIAKGRQQAFSTTIMSLSVKDVIFKLNHFMKFICEDDEKAKEIFEDKLKFTFGEIVDWMRPVPLNDRDNLFKIGYKKEKGKIEGVGSKISVVVPKRTAVAGGAPQKVLIDEAGNIPILSIMIGNARPTMYWYNPKTKKMVIKRQIWIYGTGGEMDKGGKAFETEYMAIQKAWDEGKYDSCIIPIFSDWRNRPGVTQEIYDTEKRVAYAKAQNENDPDSKKHITEFHQSNPTSISDVFRTSAKTLIDQEYIERGLERIRTVRKQSKFQLEQWGYFEPIYDLQKPMPEGFDVPYKIIGANFIPTEDIDRRASVCIFLHPERHWEGRYFKGTDPINTHTGSSNFASTIWDKYYHCPVALMDWRVPDYQKVFLQSLLLNLYYDTSEKKRGIKELVESNSGSAYTDYMKTHGFDYELVLNYQLPLHIQNRTTINDGVGIDNKGDRNDYIINRITDVFKYYGDKVFIDKYFIQLQTFTCKVSDNGKNIWGPVNRKHFMDDSLFSLSFSYICAELCFPEIQPKNLEKANNQYRIVHKLVRGKDLKLSMVESRELVK